MERPKTKIYKFPIGTQVIITNTLNEYCGTAGVIDDIWDESSGYDYVRDRAPIVAEVKYIVLVKNKQSRANFLREDPDNQSEDYDEYVQEGWFFASDLRWATL